LYVLSSTDTVARTLKTGGYNMVEWHYGQGQEYSLQMVAIF